jgi:hypothetical protein
MYLDLFFWSFPFKLVYMSPLSRTHTYCAPMAHTCNPKLFRRQRSRGSWFEASPGKYFMRPYLKKLFTKLGLVEWLKMKALSSSLSITHTKRTYISCASPSLS